jgi:polyhydroxyalkanoate synthesis regulator phasin
MAQNPVKSALDVSKNASKSAIDASKNASKSAIDASKNASKSAIDASKDAAQQAQDQIEALLKDLAASAEAQSNQIQTVLTEFRERGKENSDRVADQIDKRIKAQLGSLGLATKADITRLERKIAKLERPVKKAAAKRAPAKKAAAKVATPPEAP